MWTLNATPAIVGTNFTLIPATQFATASFTNGACLQASSATAIGSAAAACFTTAGGQSLAGTTTFSGGTAFAFGATGGTTVTNNATGSVASLVFNSNNASAPTGDLLDLQIGGSTKFQVLNSGGVTSQGPITGSSLSVSSTLSFTSTGGCPTEGLVAASANNFAICSDAGSSSTIQFWLNSSNKASVLTDGTWQSSSPSVALNSVTYTPKKGTATCTMSTSTNCTATVTVTSGAVCTASYDAATTATLATLLPLTTSVASTTLSVKGQVSGSAVSTAFTFDYVCM